jgi:endo-1,4-beta-xylanase
MEEYIAAVVGRYRGRINVWQVVNEAIGPDGRLAPTRWLESAGDDYVLKAFEFAHRADPDAELFYNGHDMLAKPATDAIVRLVRDIRARGGRIDGVGVQAHWSLDEPALAQVEAGLAALRAADAKLAITEMDITVLPPGKDAASPGDPPATVQEKLAKRYGSLFSLFLTYRDLIGPVNFWGVHDGQSWLNYWPVPGRTDHPLLFDRSLKPKPAFFAVVRARE